MQRTRKPAMSMRSLLRRIAWYVVDSVVCMTSPARDPNAVLLIRLDNIGDFVLWIDAAQQIAKHYRGLGKRVLLVAPTTWAGWAAHLSIFDEVIEVDRSRLNDDLLYRFKLLASIRRRGCKTSIVPAYSHDWSSGDAIIRISGSEDRIGSSGDDYGFKWERQVGRRWFTRLLPASDRPMMEIERNAEFASELLGFTIPARAADLSGSISPSDLEQNEAIPHPYYVLFPGASEAMRRWPVDHFYTMAQRIHAQTGWLGVVCGTAADRVLADALCRKANVPLLSMVGQTSLSALTALLSRASLLISNDTAAVHIAAALGVPTVAALGGGHATRFLPYPKGISRFPILPQAVTYPMECFDCGWWCKFPLGPEDPAPCVSNIDVELVWKSTLDILALTQAQSLEMS